MKFKLIFLPAILLTTLTLTISKNVYYHFHINYFCGDPDGVYKCNILGVNNQFPGPVISAFVGDTLHVSVYNGIEEPGQPVGSVKTTLHWHGMFQNGTPFEDGPEMVTQCPIPFGHSQTYVFKLEQWGTYWWHSHVNWQYTEGLWGAFIIHNRREVYAQDYDDEFTVTVNDWYHKSGRENTAFFLSPASGGAVPIPDSILLNGRGVYPCEATQLPCDPSKQTPYVFKVKRGKRYRIRLINSSALSTYVFSIEGHKLKVIEVDGVDTVPVEFDSIPIAAAQRYSFIVEMNGDLDQYFMYAVVTTSNTLFATDDELIDQNLALGREATRLVTTATGILLYRGKPSHCEHEKQFSSEFQKDELDMNLIRFPGEQLLQPYDRILAPDFYDEEEILFVRRIVDDKGIAHLTFNGTIYEPGSQPLLSSVILGRPIPANANPIYTGYQKVLQIVINNGGIRPHPFHLHGHTFFVMGSGVALAGNYDPKRDVLIRNGVRRDVFTVLGTSWAVLRFITDNPGVWYFHCHINWHLQAGLAATIIEAEEEAKKTLEITPTAREICRLNGVDIY